MGDGHLAGGGESERSEREELQVPVGRHHTETVAEHLWRIAPT